MVSTGSDIANILPLRSANDLMPGLAITLKMVLAGPPTTADGARALQHALDEIGRRGVADVDGVLVEPLDHVMHAGQADDFEIDVLPRQEALALRGVERERGDALHRADDLAVAQLVWWLVLRLRDHRRGEHERRRLARLSSRQHMAFCFLRLLPDIALGLLDQRPWRGGRGGHHFLDLFAAQRLEIELALLDLGDAIRDRASSP